MKSTSTARWRNLVKGIFDTEKSRRRIVVTGSARLDYYRKGGDSLANRYRYFRLHPFSLREINASPSRNDVEALLRFGGIPEPFLLQDEREHRIWQRDRIARVEGQLVEAQVHRWHSLVPGEDLSAAGKRRTSCRSRRCCSCAPSG
jgi:predicted AAA+ superfamily ATPase